MTILGIDVSNNNPSVDFPAAYRQGVDFVIAKASQGWIGRSGGWLDWTFVDVISRARAAGVMPGAYHWPLKGNGALQAHTFVQSLQRVGGPKGILCAIDVEATSWTPGVTYDPSLSVDVATVTDFLAEWDRITGNQPIVIYGASWYHDGYIHAGDAWPNRPLWWAGYTGIGPATIEGAVASVTPNFMYPFGGWSSYVIRQFTNNVQVPALGGGTMPVDADVSYLTHEQFLALAGINVYTPTGDVVMDAQTGKAFSDLTKVVQTNSQQLATIIQGVPPGHANPYGLVGNRDLAKKLDDMLAAQQQTNVLLKQVADLLGKK